MKKNKSASVEIIRYAPEYEEMLMELIHDEGEDWKEYWEEPNAAKYRRSFEQSVTYVAVAEGKVCGYSRSIKDALYIYVCDLLVNEKYRGNGIGEKLLRRTAEDYPDLPVYIMSGSDGYYEKLGCSREGSIYLLK